MPMSTNRNPNKIYVSNISHETRERDLGALFEEVGRIQRMQFKTRYAFIEYERSRCCDDAVRKFDGMYFRGRSLRVELYAYRGGDRKYRSDNFSNDYRLFVCNLDPMTSWQDLKDFGRTAGRSVTFADVRPKNYSESRRGSKELEGIIEFSNRRDFEAALKELDGARLNGVRVKVHGNQNSSSDRDRNKFSERDHGSRRRDVEPTKPRFSYRSRSRDRGSDRRDPPPRGRGSRRKSRSVSKHSRSRSRTRSRSRSRGRGRESDKEKRRSSTKATSARSPHSRSRTRSPSKRSDRSASHHSRHSDLPRKEKDFDSKRDSRASQSSHSRSPSPEALKRQKLLQAK